MKPTQAIGKAAYEAYIKEMRRRNIPTWFKWSQLRPYIQLAWVKAAQAAIKASK